MAANKLDRIEKDIEKAPFGNQAHSFHRRRLEVTAQPPETELSFFFLSTFH